MNLFCLISFAVILESNALNNLRQILKAFENSEKDLNYISIFTVDYTNSITNIINVFESPKIIVNIQYGASNEIYQHLRKVEDTSSLIFYFNSRILSVVFIGSPIEESITKLHDFLKFNFNRRIILIFEKEIIPFDEFSTYFNLISISLKYFESSKKYIIFNTFEEISYTFNGKVPAKNKMRNALGQQIFINVFRFAPYCMTYFNKSTKEYKYFGLLSHVLSNFVQFINGVTSFVPEQVLKAKNITEHQPLEAANLTTFVQFFPGLGYSNNMKIAQQRSNSIEHYKIFLIFSSPHQIDRSLYTTRPLRLRVWIAILAFIVYSTILYTICSKVFKSNGDFWESFNIVLRSLLAQSFRVQRNLFCFLTVIFGFMLTTWYSSILGSSLATLLYEDPWNTWNDVVERNITVYISNVFNRKEILNNVPELIQYKKYIKYVGAKAKHRMYYESGGDPRIAFQENSGHWKYMMVPQMDFYSTRIYQKSKDNFGRSYMFLYYEYYFKYKFRFNYFLNLIQDHGLYKYWCTQAFYENLKYKFYPSLKFKHEKAVDVLSLNFFRTMFILWSFGILSAFISLFLEIIWKKIWDNLPRKWLFRVNIWVEF